MAVTPDEILAIASRYAALPSAKRRTFRARLAERAEAFPRLPILPLHDRPTEVPLSQAQQRLWFLWKLDPASAAYNITGGVRIEGALEPALVRAALDHLVQRHESLRLRFGEIDGVAHQFAPPDAGHGWDQRDLSVGTSSLGDRLQGTLREAASAPFDLERGPVFRALLCRLGPHEHVLHLAMHHIVADGWSIAILRQEFVETYEALRAGVSPSLSPLPIQYSDYALWQLEWLDEAAIATQLTYWRGRLGAGEQPLLELPLDRPRSSAQQQQRDAAGAAVTHLLSNASTNRLKQLAQKQAVTLPMLLLAAYDALLYRYSGQSDVRVGLPVAGRDRIETEGLIGFFVNTLVIRARVDGEMRFVDLLAQVKRHVLEAQTHQDLPFARLVDALQPERSLSHTPLFQTLFNHDAGAALETQALSGLTISAVDSIAETAQFDLSLKTRLGTNGLALSFDYATALFDAATIERVADHYAELLEQIAASPEYRIGDLILSRNEAAAPAVTSFEHVSVLSRISAQTTRSPASEALSFNDERLSYGELDAWSNRIANRLRALGIEPDERIGLCLERSTGLVAGLLGILKSGGAYLPLDPAYPEERLAYMLADAGVTKVVVDVASAAKFSELLSGCAQVRVDQVDAESGVAPIVTILPDQLAYVIYTSGSTGQPKGVGITHRNVARLFDATADWFRFDERDVWTLFHSYAFDFSVWEIFGALVYGGRLVVVPQWTTRDPEAFHALLRQERVTILNQTPSAFLPLTRIDCISAQPLEHLRAVIFGGEKLAPETLARWWATQGDRAPALINMYGITETTVHVTYRPLADADITRSTRSPIGVAISDLSLRILDRDLNTVPLGTTGELYVGGAGLARGYLNRPALTAERFVPDPNGHGARLYKSGDLAKSLASGEPEYLGRNDAQVKLRGFRIELGEIQAAILSHAPVKDAAVLVRGDGATARLIAYVVSADESVFDEAALAAHLGSRLPTHLLPSAFVPMAKLPLTVNGKLDVNALPSVEATAREVTAAANDIEAALLDIWKTVLARDNIGVTDHFFEIGGDSILTLQIVARARKAGLKLTPRQLFEHPTVARLAAVAVIEVSAAALAPEITDRLLPLTPIQSELFQRYPQGVSHWNQSVLLKIDAALDLRVLAKAIDAVVARHDALRLRFEREQRIWRQRLVRREDASDLLEVIDLRELVEPRAPLEAEATRLQKSLSLSEGPLLRAGYFRMPVGGDRLLIAIHHLAVDGVSWRVLLEDLQQAYGQIERGQSASLPPGLPWTVWAQRLNAHATAPAVQNEAAWWLRSLADAQANLPSRQRAPATWGSTRTVDFKLDAATTSQLLQQAPKAYRAAVEDLLLASLVQTLCAWSGGDGLLLALEGHGREEIGNEAIDLSRTVGWFTTRYPLWLRNAESISASLVSTKETIRALPHKGLHWGLLNRHAGDATRTALNALPVPQLSFNYLGQFDQTLTDDGPFSLTRESTGQSMPDDGSFDYLLDINALVVDGELSLSWRHAPDAIDDATVQTLASDYEAWLRTLIAHCIEQAAPTATASDFALSGLSQPQLEALNLPLADVQDIYPATPIQQGLLFHSLSRIGEGVYVTQKRLTLSGVLDVEALQAAWQIIVDRHDILRTGFEWQHGGDVLQVVRKQAVLPFALHDWCDDDAAGHETRLSAWLKEDLIQGFDLQAAPLLRINLFWLGDDAHELVWTDHHLLTDGWSSAQLLTEVVQAYAALRAKQSVRLPAAAPYRDYVAWQARQPDPKHWWQQQFARVDDPVILTTSLGPPRNRQVIDSSEPYELKQPLGASLTTRLRKAAQAQRVTLNTLMQGAWAILLSRYGNRAQVAFGVTVSGRPAELPGIERMLGLFINSLPVWTQVPVEAQLGNWLQQLQMQNSELRQYEHTPLNRLQQWAGRSGDALFDTLLVFENYPVDEAVNRIDIGLKVSAIEALERTHYPLALSVMPNEELALAWTADQARIDRESVDRLSRHYVGILEQLSRVGESGLRLGEIVLDVSGEGGFEAGAVATYAYSPVAGRVSARASLQSSASALSCDGVSLSYGDLEAWSNQIASRLRGLGVGRDERVGLCIERSVGLAAGLLGIWKCGGAFVPLDPTYPEDRLAFMLEDAGVRCVVTDAVTAVNLRSLLDGCEVVVVTEVSSEPLSFAGEPPHFDQLAYVLYTSGSTGRPKGVAISHGSLSLHMDDFIGTHRITESDRVLQSSTINFDVALHELLPALIQGGSVVMRGPVPWDFESMNRCLREQRITFSRIPTAYWQQWLRHPPEAESLAALRQITVGGEALPGDALKAWQAGPLAHIQLDNLYGPTETTVACLHHATSSKDIHETIVPIGKPYPGRSAVVIDASGNEVPVGGLGELCIGGISVARGYHDRPDLTAASFVPDPKGNGTRLYRSGDLCRKRADGTIEFLGRLDQQVKLRGLRIELGEIEAVLRQATGITDAVVEVKGQGEGRYLVGYVVGDAEEQSLRQSLEARLPGYMVPSHFVHLERLPVMPNGKVDRRALPEPDQKSEREKEPARNKTEADLLAIWQAILNRQDIGVTDNFFEAGGDSILSLQLVARARTAGYRITPRQVFEQTSIRRLAEVADSATHDDEAIEDTPSLAPMEGIAKGFPLSGLTQEQLDQLDLPLADIQDIYPATPLQQGLLFHDLLQTGQGVYLTQKRLTLTGVLDGPALRAAWEHAIARHEILRTHFEWRHGGDALQVVHRQAALEYAEADWSDDAGDYETRLRAWLKDDLARGFDLSKPPLLRIHIFKRPDGSHDLVWTSHHVLTDGWSSVQLIAEIVQAYRAYQAGETPVLPMPARYRDYVLWQQRQSDPQAWWRRQFEALREPATLIASLGPLHADEVASDETSRGQYEHRQPLGRNLSDRLRTFAKQQGLTVNTLMQGAWAILLSRYGNRAQAAFGVTFSGRPHDLAGMERMLGLFINSLPVWIDLPGSAPLASWLHRLQAHNSELRQYEQTPLSSLQQWSGLTGDALFDSLLVFENFPVENEIRRGGTGLQVSAVATVQRTHYPLTLRVLAHDEIALSWIADGQRLPLSRLDRATAHYRSVLEAICNGSDRLLADIALPAPSSAARSRADYGYRAVIERISEQSELRPSSVALSCEDDTLSYGGLESWSNRIAHRLVGLGVRTDERVGLCLERSTGLVAGMLGILKSGGAYLPLDPAYPEERLAYMLADAGVKRVIADAANAEKLAHLLKDCEVVRVSDVEAESSVAPSVRVHPDQLAYVIYTSGSTGQPKGVGITHRNVARLFDATAAWFHFDERDVWTLFHSYAFDFSVWEIFGALGYGGRLVIVPPWTVRDTAAFHRLLQQERVTILNQTPSAFIPLTQIDLDSKQPLEHLRAVIFGGEKLAPETLARWYAMKGRQAPALINMYGITETTVHVTYRLLGSNDLATSLARSVIGDAIPDLSLDILDLDMNPVAIGAMGEMHVGGAGLARGYLNRPALTAERFVPDPRGNGARLYKSGDLARQLSDGEPEYIGRNDAQVKLRGFRIELGEIETALRALDGVNEAVVEIRGEGEGRYVVGYVVGAVDDKALRNGLETRLPAHMLPSAFVHLDQLPLTVNGKIDRKALPDPAFERRAVIAPRTPLEQAVAAIWSEVLGLAAIGIDDHFFDLGGHSLLAVRVITRIRQSLGREVSLQSLFARPVLADFVEAIAAQGEATLELAAIPRRAAGVDRMPLSYAQERLWFLWKLDPASTAYNMSGAMRLQGMLTAAFVRQAVDALVQRHESLRTHFEEVDGIAQQVVAVDGGCDWNEVDLTVCPELERENRLHDFIGREALRAFDLERGPLLRVTLIRLDAAAHVLHFAMHHIISDGGSMVILPKEFASCYEAAVTGNTAQLPALPIQFGDYALWQRQQLDEKMLAAQLSYWRAHLAGEQPVLELPLDRKRRGGRSAEGGRVSMIVPTELVTRLRSLSRRHEATLFMTLLAAFDVLLHRYSGQQDIRVGLPVAGRDRLETEALIGFFVNTLVIRAEVSGGEVFAALLDQVKQRVLAAQANQDVPFAKLVETLQPERHVSHSPLFQAVFNHTKFDANATVKLAGLHVSGLRSEATVAQFDLTLEAVESDDETLLLAFDYAKDLFDATTLERMSGHYLEILEQLADSDAVQIGAIALSASGEAAVVAAYAYSPVTTRISARASVQSSALALSCDGVLLSHGALEAWSNQIASRLRGLGVGRDERVGLCIERSVGLAAGLLGIWKCGGAFVPLDPTYPEDRLAFMLEDAGVRCVVTDAVTAVNLRSLLDGCEVVVVTEVSSEPLSFAGEPPHFDQLAYVLYTSGSTGRPKGVAISHGSLSLHMDDFIGTHRITESDRVLQSSTINFDVALHELLPALIQGGSVVMRGPVPWDFESMNRCLREQRITFSRIPTAYWQQWLRHPPEAESLAALRQITVGGEALPGDALKAWQAGPLAHIQLDNLYGPTETTVACLHHATSSKDIHETIVPIGKPYPGRSAVVIDASGNEVPVGGLGELCIGGISVARGYHDRPDLTAASFVPDPKGNGTRLYRSGDLCRKRADGTIEFLGRLDQQVKLRGLRIELGEIEAVLRQATGITDAVVEVKGQGEGRYLVGYVVGDAEEQSLRQSLEARLPGYMVPSHFVHLERLPVMPNGKVDRRALPEPDQKSEREKEPARNKTEADLLAIWQAILNRQDIGVTDNFFEAGGDSILSLQLVARARTAGYRITPRQVFEQTSIRRLAVVATAAGDEAGSETPKEITDTLLPLTPIQQVFFDRHPEGESHWNQAVMLKVAGALDIDAMQRALETLIAAHDALRLRFERGADGWQQKVIEAETQPLLEVVDLRDETQPNEHLIAHGNRLHRSLDIETGPLLRFAYFKLPDDEGRQLLTIHHLAVDGVSWRILLEELQEAYEQAVRGDRPSLPANTPWSVWTQKQLQHAGTSKVLAEARWWQQALSGSNNEFPTHDATDVDRPMEPTRDVHWQLDATRTRQLVQEAPRAYRTGVEDLLLTALALTLGEWSGRAGVLIGLEAHGREALGDDAIDLSRTVGWFTTRYPVWLPAACDGNAAAIIAVKESLRAVPNKGLHWGLLKQSADLENRQKLNALPQPSVGFNYLGQFDQSVKKDSRFSFATEPHGDAAATVARPPHVLDLNGLISEGELSLQWTYDTRVLSAEAITRLVERFDAQLKALLAHCLEAPATPTASDFPLAGITQAQLDALALPLPAVQDIYPATPLQQGLLFHDLLQAGQGVYLTQKRLTLSGRLDTSALRTAWEHAIARHDILRTHFDWRHGGDALQVVHRAAALPFFEHDWSMFDDDYETRLADWLKRDVARGFDLAVPPLLRITVFRRPDGAHDLVWTSHHALSDGWSGAQLIGEIVMDYKALATGRTFAIPAPPPYRNYLAWRHTQPDSEPWWRQRIAMLDEPATLLQSLPRRSGNAVTRADDGVLEQAMSRSLTRRLNEAAQAHGLTLNTLVQGAWALLLARYGNRPQVAFGVTVSGRPTDLPGVESMLGLFINTLPLWVDIPERASVAEWLRGLQSVNSELRQHEHTPLSRVQRWAGLSGDALFDSVVVFENFPAATAQADDDGDDLRVAAQALVDRTHYPLTLAAIPGRRLELRWAANPERIDAATLNALAAHYAELLERIAEGITQPVGAIALDAANAERELAAYPYRPITVRFSEQARLQPAAEAVVCADERLSLGELERWSNRIAQRLRALGVVADECVGLCVVRSTGMVAGLLGILKSGGAYVPLDPAYPEARLAAMLADAGIRRVVADAQTASRLAHLLADIEIVLISEVSHESDRDPGLEISPDQLAYAIYTSGSSGRPKGVAISHRALSLHLDDFCNAFGITASDRVLQFSTISFDAATEQLLPPLAQGGVVILRGAAMWDFETLNRELCEQRITVADFPTAYWLQWLQQLPAERLPALRWVTVGGEALAGDALRRWRQGVLGDVRFDNRYGPTEATVSSLYRQTRAEDADDAVVAIGSAYPGRRAIVVDGGGREVPMNGVGELCIGGVSLARGYLGQAALTAERFVPDPSGDGSRSYRTGDLCRRRADGTVDYLGRLDQQIKLRGFRIEPGEIEAALRDIDGVLEAVVEPNGAGDARHLVGYVVGAMHDEAAVRDALAQRLPSHMLPARIVALDALPLMPNGKLDRRALPSPQAVAKVITAPRTVLETTLLKIWQDVLQRDDIGIDDRFFDVGGDSLAMLRVASLARRDGIEGFRLEAMYAQPTIALLAAHLANPAAEDRRSPDLLLMTSARAGRKLFLVHPGYGLVAEYRALAVQVEDLFEVYGLQSPIVNDPDWAPADFRQLAEAYVQRIRQVQPQGPYALIGWSLGGLIAVEMARVLEAQGESLDLVGVIDAKLPETSADDAGERLSRDDIRTLRAKLDDGSQGFDEWMEPGVDIARWQAMLPPGIEGERMMHRMLYSARYAGYLLQDYQPAGLRAGLSLWWAGLRRGSVISEQQRRWQAISARGVIDNHVIDTDHGGIVQHADFFASLRRTLATIPLHGAVSTTDRSTQV